MTAIHNNIGQFIDLKPASYQFLRAISFTRNISKNGATSYEAEITFSKISEGEIKNMKLRCVNVVDIKIGEIESMSWMLVDILDIGEYQLEGISYRISEQENNTFSFDCSDFYVDIIEFI